MEHERRSEIAVIVPLTPMSPGETYALTGIPLHLTALPNAFMRGPAKLFEERVRRIAARFAPLASTALGVELFGPNRDIEVTEIIVTRALRSLHDALVEAVERIGGEPVVAAYWRDGFRAHVTKTQAGEAVEPGSEVQLERLALVDCSEPVRQIICVVEFAGVE